MSFFFYWLSRPVVVAYVLLARLVMGGRPLLP